MIYGSKTQKYSKKTRLLTIYNIQLFIHILLKNFQKFYVEIMMTLKVFTFIVTYTIGSQTLF